MGGVEASLQLFLASAKVGISLTRFTGCQAHNKGQQAKTHSPQLVLGSNLNISMPVIAIGFSFTTL